MTDRLEVLNHDVRSLPRPVAFVFGGGAASTCAQVGMLSALLDVGLRPDLIVGTSAGALNGAVLADDPDGAVHRLTTEWSAGARRMIIGDSRIQVARNLAGGHYMYRNGRLRELFERTIAARSIEKLAIPFACVATDIGLGIPVIIQDGPLIDALLATCAVPGVFPLIRRAENLLADGGYVANVPIRQALDLGAASIIVFDGRPRVPGRAEPKNVRDSTTAAFAAALDAQFRSDVEHAEARVPVVCLPGQPTRHIKGFDFSACAELIAEAIHTTRAFLQASISPSLASDTTGD